MDIKPFKKFVSRKNQGEAQPSRRALLQHLRSLQREVRRIRIQRFVLLLIAIALFLFTWHLLTDNGTDSNTQHQPATAGDSETRTGTGNPQTD
ncbi:MAG: hypothetical protein RID53_30055 [Coleofasciculus sp. B1-GNL1-01]|uniref:hypothetical protein n=1 Tax=Coleofasciculus sp. B1-GNL1-01 TaxID=3068484 RepID=UPI0032FD2DD3